MRLLNREMIRTVTVPPPTPPLLFQGAVFLEGVSVKGVTQVTTQPKLGQVQRKCQEYCEWGK